MRVSRSQSVAEQKQEDRAWRERFVQNALANVRLEGLEPRDSGGDSDEGRKGGAGDSQGFILALRRFRLRRGLSSDPYVYPGTTVLKNTFLGFAIRKRWIASRPTE